MKKVKETVEDKVTKYLLQNFKPVSVKNNHFEMQDKVCIKRKLDEIFELDKEIPCHCYDQVVNGEGNEKDKISAVYSSSLQSLLFFAWVSKDNPLEIEINGNKIVFENVCFEYKNKVIGYPSSVDVVLTDKNGENILFIESKLLEIIRDSDKEGKPVIGKSYFDEKRESGYKKALNLFEKNNDSPKIGITEGDSVVKPLKTGGYVYSYGIKQMLAHLIGIRNFICDKNKDDKRCSDELSAYCNANVYFMELYNAFPGIEGAENGLLQSQEDYVKHIEQVRETIQGANEESKNPFLKDVNNRVITRTYQELYRYVKGSYVLSKNIVDFYHLDEGNANV